jgi:hypothetical protein
MLVNRYSSAAYFFGLVALTVFLLVLWMVSYQFAGVFYVDAIQKAMDQQYEGNYHNCLLA